MRRFMIPAAMATLLDATAALADEDGKTPRATAVADMLSMRFEAWQWLALPLWLAAGVALGLVLARLVSAALQRFAVRSANPLDDHFITRIRGPVRTLLTVGLLALSTSLLALPEPAEALVHRILGASGAAALFWGVFRAVDLLVAALGDTEWARTTAASRALLPLGRRSLKVLVGLLALGTALGMLGVPVASVVAGLGVGGLAVALAAQKTFENLFGAFSLGVDQPFREGDFVRVDDFVGTVEQVGLRSTRVRTLDRTLISIPNGQLAEKRIESFAARDRIRLFATIGLTYSTTSTQLREVMRELERRLRQEEKIWPDNVILRFAAFAQNSIDLEVMCWFMTTDFDEFCAIRTRVFIDFMTIVERAGASFAFPTRTLHVASLPPTTTRQTQAMARHGVAVD